MLCLQNDTLIPISEAVTSIEDRGYNFGEGVYEVISFYEKKPFLLSEHLNRLQYSADQLEILLPYSLQTLGTHLMHLIERNNIRTGILYIQLTRGTQQRSHTYDPSKIGVLTATITEKEPTIHKWKTGSSMFVSEDLRWGRCDIKSLNLLGNVMSLQEAKQHGCSDAILVRNGAIITECASANLFVVKRNTLYTPPASKHVLNGITRKIVIHLAEKHNIPIHQVSFDVPLLEQADEVFATSTNIYNEIEPVIEVKGLVKRTYNIGPVTKRVQSLYETFRNQSISSSVQ